MPADEKDQDKEGRGPLSVPLARRSVFAGLGLALLSPLLPETAFARPGVGGGWYTWGGGADGGVMYNGRGVGFCNGWQADWRVNNPGTPWQGLRLALGLEMTCDYCNELYTHAIARPLMACGDDNMQHGGRLWYAGGEDNRGTIYREGAALSPGFEGDLLNTELAAGKGYGYNTGFKDYAYATPNFFIRRRRDQVVERWTAKVDISNVMANPGTGTRWYKWPEIYTTLWLGVDVRQTQDKINIRNRGDLYGLIIEIQDEQQRSMLACPAGGKTGSGTALVLNGRAEETHQNWMVEPGAADETGGYMHVLAVMNGKGLKQCINETGGAGPSTAFSNSVQLFGYDATRASEWWAHDRGGVTYLFCDGTGRLLDRTNGGHASGTVLQAHCSGYCDQFDNLAQRWRIKEVVFKGSISLPDKPLRPGSTARCPDPGSTCTPRRHSTGEGGVRYIYRWYAHEAEGAKPVDIGTITGQAHVADIGDTPEAPAHGHVGFPHIGKSAALGGRDAGAVESFRLSLGKGASGGIAYATDRGDTGADGSWCGPRGASHRFGGIRVWLTGEAARHADLAYRVFRTGSGWSDTVYSSGAGSAPLAGGTWGGSGAVRGLWVMPIAKPTDAVAVREFSTDPSYAVRAEAFEGLPFKPRYLSCAVMLQIAGVSREEDRVWTDRYRGTVLSSSQSLSLTSTVTAYADGEVVGSFEYQNGETPVVPDEILDAAQRENCTSWAGWFTDPACSKTWEPRPREGDFPIYSYNTVTVDFKPTTDSAPVEGSFHVSPDASSAEAVLVPSPVEGRWGREMRLTLPSTCFRDDGDSRWATMRSQGYFADAAGAPPQISRISPKRDTTLFLRWVESVAEGVETTL